MAIYFQVLGLGSLIVYGVDERGMLTRVILWAIIAVTVGTIVIRTVFRVYRVGREGCGLDGEGRLVSIDPRQSSRWQGCGLTSVARAGLAGRHTLTEDVSYAALPRLLAAGGRVDFAYIDGWHTFDYALLDFWYLDKMMAPGAVVGFTDCGLPAIDKVIRFVLSHRRYAELDVGLPARYAGVSWWRELGRVLRRRERAATYRRMQDRYFEKREAWEPPWNFYAPF